MIESNPRWNLKMLIEQLSNKNGKVIFKIHNVKSTRIARKIIPMLFKLFQFVKREKLPNLFSMARITLVWKPNKETQNKKL